jgi:opacity protein-like surface antigen
MAARSSIRIGVLFLVFAALMASAAEAQDEKRFGVVAAAFPGSIGFQWQVADVFAVRVDGSYTYSSTENSSGDEILQLLPSLPGSIFPSVQIDTELKNHATSLAFSGLFTIHKREQFRLYLAPRFAMNWSRSRSTTTITGLPTGQSILPGIAPADRDSTSTAPSAGASLGASYRLGERFGVFGEAGFQYTKVNLDDDLFAAERSATTIGTRTTVGVIVFF